MWVELRSCSGITDIELSIEMLKATIVVGLIEYGGARYKVEECYIHIEDAVDPQDGSRVVLEVSEVG